MTFQVAEMEMRGRFSESTTILHHLRGIAPADLVPLDDIQKALRGLWLVSLYGAFERSTNAIVEAALREISSHNPGSIDCTPAIHSIIHFPRVQSVQMCSNKKVFDNSVALFEASFGSEAVSVTDNPLAENLQNVDSNTLTWVTRLFGAPELNLNIVSAGRVNTLRERRNAVAHGRESASEVGERYTISELTNVYNAADEIISSFFLAMKDYCINKQYYRRNA